MQSAQKGVLNPRPCTFEDQAMGFDFIEPFFFNIFKISGMDCLAVILHGRPRASIPQGCFPKMRPRQPFYS